MDRILARPRDSAVRFLRRGWVPLGTGLLALARVGGSLAVTKGTASLVGPAGVAMLGAFQNVTAIALAFCSGGLNSGIVKTVAATHTAEQRQAVVAQLLKLTFLATAGTVAVLLLLSGWIAGRVLGDSALWPVVCIFAVLAVGIAINTSLLHVLVGFNRKRDFLELNLFAAMFTLLLALPLLGKFGLNGALLVAPIANSVVLFLTLRRFRRNGLGWNPRRISLDRSFVGSLAGFPMMALSSALLLPLAQLLVRDKLSTATGIEAAGFWQGVVKVSDAYMMVITYLVLMLVLPRFSVAASVTSRPVSVARPALMIAALTASMAVPVFLLRDSLISLLFSPQFRPMRDLFAAQVFGDVMRSLVLVAQAAFAAVVATRSYILVEILLAAGFVVASFALIPRHGAEGVVLGWAISAALTALVALTWLMLRRRGTAAGV